MATYTKLEDKVNNRKIQVESAVRDGDGKNISNNYAKQDGYYEGMGVGTATLSDNFNTNMTLIDTTPYVFRTAGGSLEIGGQCKEEKIIGATVIWNQLVDTDTASVATTSGHIYLTKLGSTQTVITSDGTAISISSASTSNVFDLTVMFGDTFADHIKTLETQKSGDGVAFFRIMFPKAHYAYNAGSFLNVKTSGKKVVGFNAYNPETGTAILLGGNAYQVSGTYTALSYTDINGTTSTPSLDTDNCFTPTANGTLTVTGGNDTDTCVNLYWDGERDSEFEEYEEHTYPTSSTDLMGEYKVDSNGNLYCDGDEYLPNGTINRKYQSPIAATSIPQFNQLWADTWFATETNNGVTLTNNGNGSYTLSGTAGTDGCVFTYTATGLALNAGSKYIAFNIPGGVYLSDANGNGYNPVSSAFTFQPQITIGEGTDLTTPVTFYPMFVNMTALSGAGHELTSAQFADLFPGDANNYYAYKVATGNTDGSVEYVYKTVSHTTYMYKLATPVTEAATSYAEVQMVDNWGTEEWLTDNSDDVVLPVGHYTEYLPDLKAKLEVAPEAPDTDGYYVVKRENGINTYYSAEDYLSEAGVVRMKNITVNLTCTDGTIVTGQTITITDTDSGVVYTTATYNGQPVTIQVPDTFNYNVHYTDSFTTQGGDLYLAMTNNITGTAITDVTINGVYADKLSQISTVADIKELLDDGNADGIQAALQKGRKLSVNTTWIHPDTGTSYTIPWNIVNVQTAYDSSGGEHTGVVIQMNYAFFQEIQFDAPENLTVTGDGSQTYQQDLYYYNSSYVLLVAGTDYQVGDVIPTGTTLYYNAIKDTTGNILRYGYNNYKQSAYRQWLNGVGAKGTWWTAQHVGDKAPSQLNTIGAFKGGFSTDNTFYPYLKEVRVRTALNTVTDSQPDQNLYEDVYDVFFLPSVTEMYGSANSHEGPYWEYWKQATGWSSPNNGSNTARKLYNMNNTSSAVYCWLRSPSRSDSCFPWLVGSDGYLGYITASGAFRCAPACIIY